MPVLPQVNKVMLYLLKSFRVFLCVLLFIFSLKLYAQKPVNDDFKNAEVISISGNGYDTGTFISKKTNLKEAGKEAGESIHLLQYYAGTDKKTVWYVFETKVRRSITVELKQRDTLIPQDAVGFTIYSAVSSVSMPPNLGEVDKSLTAITKFGSASNTCMPPGKYYVQVSSKLNANAEIWLNLYIKNASPAPYDEALKAFDFGILSGQKPITLDIGCYSIDDLDELKPHLGNDFTQTVWTTFSTDNFSDLLALSFKINKIFKGSDSVTLSYFLYDGDARNGRNTLNAIDSGTFKNSCGFLSGQNCTTWGLKYFTCNVVPNKDIVCKFTFIRKTNLILH